MHDSAVTRGVMHSEVSWPREFIMGVANYMKLLCVVNNTDNALKYFELNLEIIKVTI